EDGIRDPLVTGVQTCALPISQRARNRHERRYIFGEVRDRAIGLAVFDRWPVGPPRRIHQDHLTSAQRQALVAAARCVADHALALDRKSTRLNSSHEWTSYAVI